MSPRLAKRSLVAFLLLLVPVSWYSMRFDPYGIDGDAVAYMDIADLLHAHKWAAAIDGYWHPLYPAFLAAGQMLLHPSRMHELGAYYIVNWIIFWMQVGGMMLFASALVRLRERLDPPSRGGFALSATTLQLLGLGLLTIAAARELSFGKVRPDGLLQAFFLLAFGFLLRAVADDSLPAAALTGVFFGLAYLTKSFAFVLALLSIGVFVLTLWRLRHTTLRRSCALGFVAFLMFAVIASPFVTALSRQKHRFDFGDSGNLNYAWYVGGTEKMHLEPWMTTQFGAATVHLTHPEKQLMAGPGVYSYADFPLGTYPPWFDATYFNERIVPHVHVRDLVRRDGRNVVLIFRYILNHPEPWVLLLVMLALGARWAGLRQMRFAGPIVAIGFFAWMLYAIVNIEERYVTIAYFAVLLPLFAALRAPADDTVSERNAVVGHFAPALVVLLAWLSLGSMLRIALQFRRDEAVAGLSAAWRDPNIYNAADALKAMEPHANEAVACFGTMACLNDHYWARLAGVRILTEIYDPDPRNLMQRWQAEPHREEVLALLRSDGAGMLIARFEAGDVNPDVYPAARGWQRLGESNLYALPLH